MYFTSVTLGILDKEDYFDLVNILLTESAYVKFGKLEILCQNRSQKPKRPY